jgi:Ceramidase
MRWTRQLMNQLQRLKLDNLPWWVHSTAWGGCLIVSLILLALFFRYQLVDVWAPLESAREFLDPQYAERIYPSSIFRTRMNTWSNMAYILVGAYMMSLASMDSDRGRITTSSQLVLTPALGWLMGGASICLGFGSGFFHASLTRIGQQCDVGGMYAVMIAFMAAMIGIWLPSFGRRSDGSSISSWPLLVSLSLIGTLLTFVYKWSMSVGTFINVYAIVLVAFTLSNLFRGLFGARTRFQVRWFLLSVVAIVVAVQCRNADIAGTFSTPDSIWQGHAVWHLLTALNSVFLYLYLRSEEKEDLND